MRLSAVDCVCYVWYTSGGSAPVPHWSNSAAEHTGDFGRQIQCAHPTSKPWLRHYRADETTSDKADEPAGMFEVFSWTGLQILGGRNVGT